MKSDALIVLAATSFVAASWPAPPVLADISSNDAARIRQYQDQSINFQVQGKHGYSLKQSGKGIGDLDLASASDDPALTREIRQNQRNQHIWELASGIVGVPLGVLIAADNFFGKRTQSEKVGGITLPRSVFAPFDASSPGSFVLSVGGAVLALYGAWQIGELIGEAAGTYHPNYLSAHQAKAAVQTYNQSLASELGLSTAEIAKATPEATPSLPTTPIPPGFPTGETGSGCWAVREAIPFIQSHLGQDMKPFLVWTPNLYDFETGLIQTGAWHVLFAGADPADDVDASVPLHGSGITWTGVDPYFASYRDGTNLLDTVKVDSPRALFLLKQPFVDRQIGWLPPGTKVVLFPHWGRLRTPVWTIELGFQRLPPPLGIDAEFGTLVDMARYRL